jgi:hypothetical protein
MANKRELSALDSQQCSDMAKIMCVLGVWPFLDVLSNNSKQNMQVPANGWLMDFCARMPLSWIAGKEPSRWALFPQAGFRFLEGQAWVWVTHAGTSKYIVLNVHTDQQVFA